MKVKGWIWLGLIIVLGVTNYHLLQTFLNKHGQGLIEVYLKENTQINYDTYHLKTYERPVQAVPIAYKEKSIYSKGVQEIRLIGTNELFLQTETLTMISGNFFSHLALSECRNVMVISDTLAYKLFNTHEVVGNTYEIEGILYEVIGVYDKYDTVWGRMTDDRVEDIYVPITSNILADEYISQLIFFDRQVDETYLKMLGINEHGSIVHNNINAGRVITNYIRIPWFILGLVLIVIIVRKIILQTKKQYQNLHRWKNHHYWMEAIYKERQSIVLYLIKMVAYLGGILIIYNMVSFDFFVHPNSIPPYNIFDIKHYVKMYYDEVAFNNYISRYQITHFGAMYQHIKRAARGIMILQGICIYYMSIYIFKKSVK